MLENRPENSIDPDHTRTRFYLRTAGLIIAAAGILFLAVGTGEFFISASALREPRYFWCNFVGMPLLFVGSSMCMAGFMGAVARYQAGEIAPVGKDLFNTMAEGTQTGVRTTAAALAMGLARGLREGTEQTACQQCSCGNDAHARFCKQCGRELLVVRICAKCQAENPGDAKFCADCGAPCSS